MHKSFLGVPLPSLKAATGESDNGGAGERGNGGIPPGGGRALDRSANTVPVMAPFANGRSPMSALRRSQRAGYWRPVRLTFEDVKVPVASPLIAQSKAARPGIEPGRRTNRSAHLTSPVIAGPLAWAWWQRAQGYVLFEPSASGHPQDRLRTPDGLEAISGLWAAAETRAQRRTISAVRSAGCYSGRARCRRCLSGPD
jgi:hypothetical protein